MANLPSSGQISLSDIRNNRAGSTGNDISLKSESELFASGSTVAGSSIQTTARKNLEASPYAMSEFFNSDFNTDIITGITFSISGQAGGVTDVVENDDLTINFTTDGSETGDYDVELVRTSNSFVAGTRTVNVSSGTSHSTTFSSLNIDAADYKARVKRGFATLLDDTAFEFHELIGNITITDPNDVTVANNSVTTAIEHQISITDSTSFNEINWTFAKSSGDGSVGTSTISNSQDLSPSVTYTGAGVFTIDCRVDGTPSQARNSSTAAQVTHRIDFAKAITVNNPSSLNEGGTITALGQHQGFSSGIDVDLIRSDNNNTLLENDDTTDSRVTITNYNKTFSAPARTDSTLSVKVKAFDGSTVAESNAFNIYPLISQQLDSNDIVFGASAVEVNQNVTLDVANDVTDNIVGYQWSNEGSGNMTVVSGNASAGDTDGTSSDSTSIIDLTDQSHPTVRFDTVEQGKTIRLRLYGRINQDTGASNSAEKTIDVELADALSITAISNTNSPNAITVQGNHSGFENGVTVGLATSASPNSFIGGLSREETTTQDSRFTQRSFSENFTPADQLTTQTLQGRVVADVDGDSANTSTFSYFPELKNTRNVINPNRSTIYSTTNNNDTSNYPTSVTYSTPTNATDNVTSRTYSASSLSGHTFQNGSATSHAATTTTYGGGDGVTTSKTISLNIAGNSSQTSLTTHTLAVLLMPRPLTLTTTAGGGTGTIFNTYNVSATWQGFAIEDSNDKVVLQLFTSGGSQVGGDVEFNGTNSAISPDGSTTTAGDFGKNQQFNSLFSSLNSAGTYNVRAKFISNGSQVGSTLQTSNFSLTKPQQINIIGVYDEDEGGSTTFYGGFKSLLEAANEDDSNSDASTPTTDNVAVFVADTSIDNGDKISTNSDLSNNFDGDPQNNNSEVFYAFQNFVFEVADNGDVSNSRSRTPDVPNTPTQSSVSSDDITISITANTVVTSTFGIRVSPAINSSTTANINVSGNSTSHTQTQSLKAAFGNTSLSSGQAYSIEVRGQNSHANSNYSSAASISTSAAATSISGPADYSQTEIDGSTSNSPLKQFTITNPSGNTTITFAKISGTTQFNVKFAAEITGTPSSFVNSGNTITKSQSTNINVITQFEGKQSLAGQSGVYRLTVTNNSVSDTVDVTLVTFDEGGFFCISDTMMLNVGNGMLHIDELTKGDMILSHNFETNKDELTKITKILRVKHNVYSVKFTDYSEMILTDDHPMLSVDGHLLSINNKKTFNNYNIEAQKLMIGDKIKSTNNFVVVESITKLDEQTDTYTVLNKNNNFYTNNVLVHSEIIEK